VIFLSALSTVTDSIRAKQQERDHLLTVLEMWEQVEAQGIDPEAVKSFTFDPSLLTPEQKRFRSREIAERRGDPFVGEITMTDDGRRVASVKMFNVVRMRDGRRVVLEPMIDRV